MYKNRLAGAIRRRRRLSVSSSGNSGSCPQGLGAAAQFRQFSVTGPTGDVDAYNGRIDTKLVEVYVTIKKL